MSLFGFIYGVVQKFVSSYQAPSHSWGWGHNHGTVTNDQWNWHDKSYDISGNDTINAGCGDDIFKVGDISGHAKVDGNRGHDVLDLSDHDPDSYVIKSYEYCGKISGYVQFYDDNGCPGGKLTFCDIEEIVTKPEIEPDGIVSGTAGDDMINLDYVDVDGDRIDHNDALNIPVVGTNNDIVHAGDGNDTVYGVDSFDQIRGNGGDDVLYGGDGDDLMFGDEGNDRLDGEAGNDVLYGGDGDDYLDDSEGNDRMFGGTGNDTLLGGAGDDVLYGDSTSKTEGYLGEDTFIFDTDDGFDQVWDFVEGVDTLVLQGGAGAADAEFTYFGNNPVVFTEIAFGDSTIRVYNNDLDAGDVVFI